MPKRRRGSLSKKEKGSDVSTVNGSSEELEENCVASTRKTRLSSSALLSNSDSASCGVKKKKNVSSEEEEKPSVSRRSKGRLKQGSNSSVNKPTRSHKNGSDNSSDISETTGPDPGCKSSTGKVSNPVQKNSQPTKKAPPTSAPSPNKTHTPKRSNPLGMTEHEMLLALDESGSRLRKRRFAQSYHIDLKQCPISGCDGRGHLLGKYERHFTPATCPLYHNLTPERCKENHEAYTRLKQERAAELQELENSAAHHNTRKQADAGLAPGQLK